MAAITSVASGNWTAGGTWSSGAAPLAADTVTIAKNHVITLDNTTCVCSTLTLAIGTTGADNGGQLTCSTTANSKLVCGVGITAPGSTGNGGSWSTFINLDMSAATAYTCEIVLNLSRATGVGGGITSGGNFVAKGTNRTRWTTTTASLAASGTTVTVADATGWVTGDKVIFATTSAYNATPRTDEVTATVSGTTLTFSAVTYAHASGCPVGNFTSNLIFRPDTAGDIAFVHLNGSANRMSVDCYVMDVEFRSQNAGSTQGSNPFSVNTGADRIISVSNNAFYDFRATAFYIRAIAKPFTRERNIFYSATASVACTGGQDVSGTTNSGPDEYYAIFRAGYGVTVLFQGQNQNYHVASGLTASVGPLSGMFTNQSRINIEANDCKVWSSSVGLANTSLTKLNRVTFGSECFAGANNTLNIHNLPGETIATDCLFPATLSFSGISALLAGSKIKLVNKNADPAVQEIYTEQSLTVPAIQRDTTYATTGRSTSAILMTHTASTAIDHSFEVLTKAGQTINIQCLVRKSSSPAYGASTLPKVTISGLGITPVTTTMDAGTAADTWETLTCNATNSGSADGLLTVTFTGQSATAGAKCWFSGVPVAPFVSRCRHYGYTFDEASPTRTVNITTSANEATAAAYTGMAVTWGASLSTTVVSADNTFQKLYDYTQAQACLNVGSAMPLTGAGVAGSPALFAAGAITTTGFTLNGAGSLSMGAFVLTASVPWVYTYTGGTFAQVSTVPSFSSGTLAIGDGGTYTFTQGDSMLVQVTSAGNANYTFSAGSFTGTLTVNNMNATPVTVFVPAGTTTSSAGNTGGAITFSAPIVQQSVTVSGVVAGSRVQIYDTTNSIELFNDTTGYTWTDPSAAVAPRDIRVRIAKQSGATAYNFLEAAIGTCGTTSPSNAVTYLASQSLDTVYNANALDGSAVTGISIDDGLDRLVINIGGGSVSWPQIYAYQVYWLTTSAGIIDDGSIINALDTANYSVTLFQIRNSSATPLSVTGGYGVDSSTGTVAPLIDVAGSTGNIYQTPDHVVPYQTTGTYAITGDITTVLTAIATVPTASDNADAVWAKTLP